MHKFEHSVNLFCDKAIVVHHLGTIFGKVHVTAQGKPLWDRRNKRCGEMVTQIVYVEME